MGRISDFAQKITKKSKPSSSPGKSYGTFPKATKDLKHTKKSEATNVGFIEESIEFETAVAPVIEKPEIFAVIVEVVKYGMDDEEEEEDTIEPVPTPEKNKPFKQIFPSNKWWLKSTGENWYPYDNYLQHLNGRGNKRERVFGLWVNLISLNKKTITKRWNEGDASIESQVKNETRPLLKGPVDEDWKMPLWLRAQPFRLMCYDNPFQEGRRIEIFDEDLDKLINGSNRPLFRPQVLFLSIETVNKFSPKVKYPKPGEYKRIFCY